MLSRGIVLLALATSLALAPTEVLNAAPSAFPIFPQSDSPQSRASLAAAAPGESSDAHPADAISNLTLADFTWLEGNWQGNWGPRTAEQIWSQPRAGEMLGLFRVIENDKVLVVELYSLLQTPAGIELRLRHFTGSLVPWEQSGAPVLKLTSFDPKAAVFENPSTGQPTRITLIRVDPDNYISRSEIISASGANQVTEIHYHKEPRAPSTALTPRKNKTNPASPSR